MSKEYSRTQRLNQLLKEEISLLIRCEVKDSRVGSVTVTAVEVSPDLKVGKVYFQASGDEGRKAEALKGLASAAGFIRTRLGRELRIRRVPELRFIMDRTQERAARITQLLSEVREDTQADGGEDGE